MDLDTLTEARTGLQQHTLNVGTVFEIGLRICKNNPNCLDMDVFVLGLGQRTGCCHTFCRLCIQEYVMAAGEPAPQCPTCQKPLTVDFTGTKSAEAKEKNAKDLGYKRTSILSRIDLDQFQTSTKIDALVSPP